MNSSNLQTIISASVLIILCIFACYSQAAPSEQIHHSKAKRSPFLRLDELNTKLYLTKNKLGGGVVDPFEVGKRSSPALESDMVDSDLNLAVALYDGLASCISREKCSRALKVLIEN